MARGDRPPQLPDLPRCQDLEARIRTIMERNSRAFPADLRAMPMRVAATGSQRTMHEHDGVLIVRQLLGWAEDHPEIVIHAGSFTAHDDRGPADELDAPTVLAWRLLEDLCALADELEEDIPPPPSRIAADQLADITDEALAANPQFFPPWLNELLAQGAFVIDTPPEFDEHAVGFFEETELGSRVVIVAPNLLDGAEEFGDAWVRREVLLTLCHEFEHHYGSVRGYDPMGDREAFFDSLGDD